MLLQASYEVALERVRPDPDRVLSRCPEVLEVMYDPVDGLLPRMPPSDWAFDTAGTSPQAVVDELAQVLLM